jgi:RNA recognition motif. (a.k.a. RRM, RBD, or RNP domain)
VEDVYIMRDAMKQSRGLPFLHLHITSFFCVNPSLVFFVVYCNFSNLPLLCCIGCGFVKFATRDQAQAAMNDLNGNFVMRVRNLC